MKKAAIYGRKNLPELLASAAHDAPGRGVGFVQSDGSVHFVTYPALLAVAEKILGGLQDSGLRPGDKAMIITSKNEDTVTAAWACFLGGIVPTILQPPVSFTEFNHPAQKIENVFRILGSPRVILSPDMFHQFHSAIIPEQRLLNFEDMQASEALAIRHDAPEGSVAFIQFSSGSTGDPKGIVLTHRNILVNLAAISVGLDIHDTDIMANWMPLYHDMGFFGFHMTPVFAQSNHHLIDPVDFVKKPAIWPDVMSKARTTITGCPNFGQALLLRYLKNRENREWDLSSLKSIVNGAEPISTRIMAEFMAKLAGNGLRKEAMMPAYGMAEATLAISFADLWKEPVVRTFHRNILQREGIAKPETAVVSEMIELVGVGRALNDTEIRVVDEIGRPVDEAVEGHIQVKGPGITSGYYEKPEETRRSFDEDWLKTGDKGFFFEGELYITGRVKDIIFVRGQNLYAHDLENLAARHSDIPYGKIIIGGLFDPEKGHDKVILFIVGMVNPSTAETCTNLRNFFRDTYGIRIEVFVPVRSNQVPKTSSGKIQRYKLLTDFRNGEFDDAIQALKKLL